MRLLLDENLSPALVDILAEVYPGTAHVRNFGLKSAPDSQVWAHAASGGYTIVTKDADFHHRSFFARISDKVIWIKPYFDLSSLAHSAQRQKWIHFFRAQHADLTSEQQANIAQQLGPEWCENTALLQQSIAKTALNVWKNNAERFRVFCSRPSRHHS